MSDGTNRTTALCDMFVMKSWIRRCKSRDGVSWGGGKSARSRAGRGACHSTNNGSSLRASSQTLHFLNSTCTIFKLPDFFKNTRFHKPTVWVSRPERGTQQIRPSDTSAVLYYSIASCLEYFRHEYPCSAVLFKIHTASLMKDDVFCVKTHVLICDLLPM